MANKKRKSGNLIAGTIAIVLAAALVLAYVITSSVKGTWSPLEWFPQEYSGHLNVDTGDTTDDPDDPTENPGEETSYPILYDTLGYGSNATIKVDCVGEAKAGDNVSFTITLLDTTYYISRVVLRDEGGSEISELGTDIQTDISEFTFIMPEHEVTIMVYLLYAEDRPQTTSFTIGDTTLTEAEDNFTFAAGDETDYPVTGAAELGTYSVIQNPTLQDISFPGDSISVGRPYSGVSSFCMRDCFYTVLGAENVSYSELLDDAERYFNDGVPLFLIIFSDSTITFGILIDVSDFEPGEPEPW